MALTNPTAQKSGNVTWLLEFSKGGRRRTGLDAASFGNINQVGRKCRYLKTLPELHYSAGARSQRSMAVSPDANTSVSSLVNLSRSR